MLLALIGFLIERREMKSIVKSTFATAIVFSVASAMAGPMYTFSLSQGYQPVNVGTITLTQKGTDAVDVSVDLLSGYGFVNTGGPHTPFAFNLSGSGALSISSFTTPANGVYASGVFALNTSGGANTPYGTFGISLDSSADNGSGNGYYGDLLFTLNRTGGLDTNDFVRNSDNDPIVGGSYFSADLSNGANTGAQAWATREEGDRLRVELSESELPEPATLALLGLGLAGFRWSRRRT